MADQNAQPSIDPSNLGTFIGMFKTILRKQLQNTDDMLPAKVIAVNRDQNIVQVQPLMMIKTTNDTNVSRAQIAAVPILQIGGGGFMLNFPVKAGDLGFIKANDRDISLFMQSFTEAPLNTLRFHSFSDAVFIPAVLHDFAIAEEDAENMVLQNLAGTVRISLWADKVKITAPTVVIDAPDTHITGDVVVDGNMVMGSGNATITGNINVNGEVTANGIPLSSHHHGGVQTGGGNTGGPAA